MTQDSKKNVKSNRLINEKSPYLQQHAKNPVDWYPWGEEAIQEAKQRRIPIFLSIGYSTCHWCHVMEHESFEDPETAELMNKLFINIKVDREERPDLDSIYMDAVQLLTGSGGWPMSVWLTPDLVPFYGGTYFPPDERYNRPGFKTILKQVSDAWHKKHERVVESANQIRDAMEQINQRGLAGSDQLIDVNTAMDRVVESLGRLYDKIEGGFGGAPKFPMPVYVHFLLTYYARTQMPQSLEWSSYTFKKMIRGGIYDQLGGGFARYSTDAQWVVPHFEKMLYDNAQLIALLVDLYQITRDEEFKNAARQSLAYIKRDMTHPDGAFYSGEDADSEGKEGKFYVWTLQELKKGLGESLAEPFIYRYGLTPNGNFLDPHTGETGHNILVQVHTVEETAKKFKTSLEEMEQHLAAATGRLFDIRSKRVRPHLDDKILTGWNGLMISAFSKAGVVFRHQDYTDQAKAAALFIKKELYQKEEKFLYKRWRAGEKKILAHQPDYALFIQGLIDLYEATLDADWLRCAADLHDRHNALFYDQNHGGYFMTIPLDDLLIRKKDDADHVLPSGNAVAVKNGFRLGAYLNNKEFVRLSRETLAAFSKQIDVQSLSFSTLVTAYDFDSNGHRQIVVVGPHKNEQTQSLINEISQYWIPQKLIFFLDPEQKDNQIITLNPFLKNMSMINRKPTAYVCENYICKNPATDAAQLRALLKNNPLRH